MRYRFGRLDGDAIGPEIVPAAVAVVDAAIETVDAPAVDWLPLPMGASALAQHGSPMPEATVAALEDCHGCLMGPHDSASYPADWRARARRPPAGELRHRFDLYANVRPSRNRPGVPSLVDDVDLVVVRENTEGFYVDRNMYAGSGESMPTPDLALAVGVFTRAGATRIAEWAFQLAAMRKHHVTVVHKSNVIPMAFGLFIEACEAVAERYPRVRMDTMLFDAITAHLVRRPQQFDVIVAENMFGDTLSDLTGELVGALGLAGSLNAGERHAMAQAAHGSAPDIAGQGIANPVGIISSASMLLEWVAERYGDQPMAEAARRIDAAVDRTLADGVRTRDLGGTATTQEFTATVVERIAVRNRDGTAAEP